MLYTVYRTTNLVNGRFYIGVHKTEDPNDDYKGSGKLLWRAIEKYGWANFKKEVLFIFDTLEKAFAKEEELVEEAKKDVKCYNLNKGGRGGWDFLTEEERIAASKKGSAIWSKQGHSKENCVKISKAQSGVGNSQFGKCWINDGVESKKVLKADLTKYTSNGWKVGRIPLESMINKLPSPNKGRVCIVKDGRSKTVDSKDLQSYLGSGWNRGRK
jgi:hypothetical protein